MKHFDLKTALVALGMAVSTAAFAADKTPNIFVKDFTSDPKEWTVTDLSDNGKVQTMMLSILGDGVYTGAYKYNNEDYTDKQGIRHICLQQWDATKDYEGKQIYVHMKKDGEKWMVHMITGDVFYQAPAA